MNNHDRTIRERSRKQLLCKLAIFVLLSGGVRTTEHYLLYRLHPSNNTTRRSAANDDDAQKVYESIKNATLSVSGGLLALAAVAVFSNGDDAPAIATNQTLNRSTSNIKRKDQRPTERIHWTRRTINRKENCDA